MLVGESLMNSGDEEVSEEWRAVVAFVRDNNNNDI
jgi:hypothetical protein